MSINFMKKCDKIRKLFGSYLCDGVTPGERAIVEEHIGTCEECASDLRNLQEILERVKPDPQPGHMPQKMENEFASNVYKRIASEVLQKRSRWVFLRKFVFQPSLAMVATAILIAVGVSLFQPVPTLVDKPSATPVESADDTSARQQRTKLVDKPAATPVESADNTSVRQRRANLYEEEFFKRQGTPHESYPIEAVVERTPTNESIPLYSSDVDNLIQRGLLPVSQRLLEEADLINYSLGEPRRALAKYQWVVDYYPDTDAAVKARVRIRAILGNGPGTQIERVNEGQIADSGI